MSHSLCLERVAAALGGQPILEDFSLKLEGPGVVSLLGPSGCGKTTLLRLAAGLLRPTQGRLTGMEGARVSVMFQDNRLLPWYSARRNVEAVLPQEGQERAAHLLRELGLGEEMEKVPAELSGGMCRRVALARALAYDGDLLLLDEPMNGLDMSTREQALNVVARHLAQRPRLCLWITHDPREMAALARETILLSGPPLEIVGRHVWGAASEPRSLDAREALVAQLDEGYTAQLGEERVDNPASAIV